MTSIYARNPSWPSCLSPTLVRCHASFYFSTLKAHTQYAGAQITLTKKKKSRVPVIVRGHTLLPPQRPHTHCQLKQARECVKRRNTSLFFTLFPVWKLDKKQQSTFSFFFFCLSHFPRSKNRRQKKGASGEKKKTSNRRTGKPGIQLTLIYLSLSLLPVL